MKTSINFSLFSSFILITLSTLVDSYTLLSVYNY